MEVIQVNQAEAMAEAVKTILERLAAVNNDGAKVLTFSGELGAGKTTLMQHLAAQLGVTETVTSPTFVVMKVYDLETASPKQLVHIDAYRIEDIDEMRVLGFSELLKQKDTIIGIEWPEKIQELIPPNAISVKIEIVDSGRQLTIT